MGDIDQSHDLKSNPRSVSLVPDYCPYRTYLQCPRRDCNQIHFKAIVRPHTEVSLGDCSYLDTCHRSECKYIHYETPKFIPTVVKVKNVQPAWYLNTDIRRIDFTKLGTFDVVIADPPYDIHMNLPCMFVLVLANYRRHVER